MSLRPANRAPLYCFLHARSDNGDTTKLLFRLQSLAFVGDAIAHQLGKKGAQCDYVALAIRDLDGTCSSELKRTKYDFTFSVETLELQPDNTAFDGSLDVS